MRAGVAGGVLLAMALVACGDPNAVRNEAPSAPSATTIALATTVGPGEPVRSYPPTYPPSVTTSSSPISPPPSNVLAFCDEWVDMRVAASQPQFQLLSGLVEEHRDVLAGVWWDQATGEFVLLGVDQVETKRLAREAGITVRYRVDVVTRSYAQLEAILGELMPKVSQAQAAFSGSIRLDGRVSVDLAVRDAASVQTVADLAGADADAVCVAGGAEPSTVVPTAPQPTGGDGWRLMHDGNGRVAQSPVAAGSADALATLWSELGLVGPPPTVLFERELVVAFAVGESSSCRLRLDSVMVDRAAGIVRALVVRPGGDRPCTLDLIGHLFVVAVDAVPAGALTLQVRFLPCTERCDGEPQPIVRR